jgi:hypothetical protein
MLSKTNFTGYEKDTASNLVINKNKDEYTLYVQNRERAKEFRRLTMQVDKLTKEMADLKQVVNNLLNSQSGNNNG